MSSVEENIRKVLAFLTAVSRDEAGYAWTTGEPIAEATGLSPADINDAVRMLVESGQAKWLQALGSHPWQFTLVAVTPQGRMTYENATVPSKTEAQPAVMVNIRAENFSGIAAGSVSGQQTIISHQSSTAFDPKGIRHAINELKKYKGDLGLNESDTASVDSEIEAVDAELATSSPDQSKIKRALESISKTVQSGVKEGIKSVVATGIIHLLTGLL